MPMMFYDACKRQNAVVKYVGCRDYELIAYKIRLKMRIVFFVAYADEIILYIFIVY